MDSNQVDAVKALHEYNHRQAIKRYCLGGQEKTHADFLAGFYSVYMNLHHTFINISPAQAFDDLINGLRALGVEVFQNSDRTWSSTVPKEWEKEIAIKCDYCGRTSTTRQNCANSTDEMETRTDLENGTDWKRIPPNNGLWCGYCTS